MYEPNRQFWSSNRKEFGDYYKRQSELWREVSHYARIPTVERRQGPTWLIVGPTQFHELVFLSNTCVPIYILSLFARLDMA